MRLVFKNMTFSEYLKSYLHLLDSPLRYISTYKNGISVMIHLLQNKFPFQGILRDGKKIVIHNYYEAYLTSFNILSGYKIEDDLITISKNDFPDVKLHFKNNNGDIHGVFFKEIYDFLNVKDKTVLDIGANIGDSSIYFVLNGAKKVIALEPFPKNHAIARKNIELNGLSDKIVLLSTGCTGVSKEMLVDPDQEGAGSTLVSADDGIKIQSKTLKEIITDFEIPDDSIMKIDCEGCEVDVILSSDKNILQKFSQIQIEYHYGYKDLKEKLEQCGFDVIISPPLFLRNRQNHKSLYFGNLYCKNRSNV